MSLFVVDSHCDSIQLVDNCIHPLVNPHNYSAKYKQLQFVAMFCSWPGDDVEHCYKRAVRYIGHFCMAMESEKDNVIQVRTYADIERAMAENKHAALMTVEGGTGVKGSTKILNDFFNIGVRVFGLAWLTNDLAKSNRLEEGEEDTGLTDVGRQIVEEGNRLGMIFDVSHLSDQSFWDLVEIAKKPVIATHSNFRSLCSHSRNLTDDMARKIVESDGMIGLNFYPPFIDDNPDNRTVARLFDHLDYCIDHFGSDNIGFGSDIDGTSGKYPTPIDREISIHDQMIDYMYQRGYNETLIEKVVGGNFLNYLRKYL